MTAEAKGGPPSQGWGQVPLLLYSTSGPSQPIETGFHVHDIIQLANSLAPNESNSSAKIWHIVKTHEYSVSMTTLVTFCQPSQSTPHPGFFFYFMIYSLPILSGFLLQGHF
jgi:hypothetical protein